MEKRLQETKQESQVRQSGMPCLRSKLHPNRFQIFVSGEIGWHRTGNSFKRTMDGCSQDAQEFFECHPAKICRTEQQSISVQALGGEIGQISIVILNPEDFRFPIPGKSGRIENNYVKFSSLALKTPQPIENISINKIMIARGDPIDFVISLSSIEIVA